MTTSVALPIRRLAADLRARRVSSLELVEACLARIAAEPTTNAVVEIDADRARAAARAADRRLREPCASPLCGLPFTVKRTFEVRGFAHTRHDVGPGEPFGIPAARDATAVSSLRALGAVVIGRTNAPARAADIDTVHPVFGRTRHPADPRRSPGGSSGGSAAAVAAGHSTFDLTSDVAGSARIPAHACGLFALRSTAGALPTTGHEPGSASDAEAIPMLAVSPMTRYADDLRVVYAAMRGGTGDVAPDAPHRIAAVLADDAAPLSPQVRDALSLAMERLRRAGHHIREIRLPVGLRETWLLCQQLIYAEEPADLPPGTVADPTVDTDPMEVALWGRTLSPQARQQLHRRRAAYRHAWQQVFSTSTAVLLPVMGVTALPARDPSVPVLADTTTVTGRRIPLFSLSMWCAVASVGGMPAVSMPIPSPPGSLPVGLQVIAAPGRDMHLLALVAELSTVLSPGARFQEAS
ncbi:amidase family protein [Micromonospora sp. NPDC051925]|uniref:amidase family protein n=1 Tax=Micromonospora sp. NPDC051925 TaxID=3364288 RepID=UPI0037C51F73